MGENLQDEYDALEDADDVHLVSVTSLQHDTDRGHHKYCSFDCWLKTQGFTPLEPLPRLQAPTSEVLENDTRRLWIDSICINQQDLRERSEQAINMHRIYQQARRVIVWLGEESEDSHMAIQSMEYLDSKDQREKITLRNDGDDCYIQVKKICKAQSWLLTRPWFRRSWIR